MLDWNHFMALVGTALGCVWIWAWVIIADIHTWTILREDCYGLYVVYVVGILYQIFLLVAAVNKGDRRNTSELRPAGSREPWVDSVV